MSIQINPQAVRRIAIEGVQGIQGPPGADGQDGQDGVNGGLRYEQTFTDASLSIAGILVVNHNLEVYPASARITNASGDRVYPDDEDNLTTSIASFNLSSFSPLQGTWRIVING
jgi:hypothetical protein